ncbi:Serine/threonine-protein phosphatase 2B catalytic subunit alpha isoform [Tritrichomonas foetus]|uniref:Serine/threonine-protein phosphatase n=1 Tax=Tritrichomonas foetus TaxID=1144522 RepID=A0A1J4KT93_9EUKA|nr:Serine/threonine-protein phosphatase 2B catalytic subunit alpha isoform [Tritrichomonas foetus]|eukprot:OHT14346.1 Serine/threonine-protein phosphatase 2B catalytic subunit alpha isoform [Tritrichomonas foetus]
MNDKTKVSIPPIKLPFVRHMFFNENNQPIVANIRDAMKTMRPLPLDVVFELLTQGANILREEPNILHIKPPIIIAGDIHGQFYDLLNIFAKYSELPRGKYLFLGDYVDRGNFSVETFLYLLALKIRYPSRIFLLRGNHETRIQTATFSFLNETKTKYNFEVYNKMITAFDCLPLAAIVGEKLFCIHGGLSPDLKYINALDLINRFHEPQKISMMHDILWSDPHPNFDETDGIAPPSYQPNIERNCSFYYTFNDVKEFLKHNNLRCIVRAHTVETNGFRLYKKIDSDGFPSVFSIFSAPHYCNELDNQGAVLYFDGKDANIIRFQKAPEPFVLPENMGLFEWIVPIVGQQITTMFQSIWESTKDDDKDDDDPTGKVNWHQKMESLGKICDAYQEMTKQTESHFDKHLCEPFKDNSPTEQDAEYVKEVDSLFECDDAELCYK